MTGPRGQRPHDDLKIVFLPISSLKPNPRNARTHTRRQIRKIAHSIRALGFNCPIIIDDEENILAGNAVLKAAESMGMTGVPTMRLSHMTEAEKRAFVIAHNRLAEEAGWDRSLLAVEFKALFELAPELDLTITGFEFGEIEFIIDALDQAKTDALDDVAPSDPGIPVVTRHGDLWQLDRHRVLCVDATQPESYARVLQGQLAQMVFADPPYNVPIDGHVSGLGQVKHADFPMASGELSDDEFAAFLTIPLEQIRIHSTDGAIAFVCMDWRHYDELLVAARAAKLALKNLLRVGQDQRRHGHLLPLAARTHRRLQGRNGTAYQQLRARPARTLPHQRLDLSRCQQLRRQDATRRSPCIRRSSRWHSSPMPSRIARSAMG